MGIFIDGRQVIPIVRELDFRNSSNPQKPPTPIRNPSWPLFFTDWGLNFPFRNCIPATPRNFAQVPPRPQPVVSTFYRRPGSRFPIHGIGHSQPLATPRNHPQPIGNTFYRMELKLPIPKSDSRNSPQLSATIRNPPGELFIDGRVEISYSWNLTFASPRIPI